MPLRHGAIAINLKRRLGWKEKITAVLKALNPPEWRILEATDGSMLEKPGGRSRRDRDDKAWHMSWTSGAERMTEIIRAGNLCKGGFTNPWGRLANRLSQVRAVELVQGLKWETVLILADYDL